jgi:hypothetical protein
MFDPAARAFIEDPHPDLEALRETVAVHYDARLDRYLVASKARSAVHARVRPSTSDLSATPAASGCASGR